MNSFKTFLAAILLLNLLAIGQAQVAGELDSDFNPGAFELKAWTVSCVALAGNGKVYLGGSINKLGGLAGIVRLNADGTVDPSFHVGSAIDGSGIWGGQIRSIAVQTDGKVLIGGGFTSYNGVGRNFIARLNNDGSLDDSFQIGLGANASIYSIALQADGKILISGQFSAFNGTARGRVARLHSDGSLDTSFNPGSGANSRVSFVTVNPNGTIYIAGYFRQYNGSTRIRVARLHSDGRLDTSFDPGEGPDQAVNSLAVQADGKILIGGIFTKFNGTTRRNIARLNPNGTLDTSFQYNLGTNLPVHSVVLQADGKAIIGGQFTRYHGATRPRVARLNLDGTPDESFNPGGGASGGLGYSAVNAVAIQPDGKIFLGGAFGLYNGAVRSRIVRINSNGSLDSSFVPGLNAKEWVEAVAVQADGKAVIGGFFSSYQGSPRSHIARVNLDGTLDTSFDPGLGITDNQYGYSSNGSIHSVVLQPDGKILIGGSFRRYQEAVRNRVARLNSDGSLDTTFDAVNLWALAIHAIAVQNDGKILIAGRGEDDKYEPIGYIYRLNADGSADTSFNPGRDPNAEVSAIAVQPDGKILIAGSFTKYNGATRNRIARINPNGSLDTSFNPGAGANLPIKAIVVQPDGKVLIGGEFTSFQGKKLNRVARLNSNGSLDSSFSPGAGASGSIRTLILQADGKVLLGGDFTEFDGTARGRIARLNRNGSLDTSFNPGSGADDAVYTLGLQADGSVLIGGGFGSYDDEITHNLIRVRNDNESTGRTFHFTAPLFLSPPSSSSVEVVIRRWNGDTAASVRISTRDGIAEGPFNAAVTGLDYEPLNTVVHFAQGETLKEVVITLKPRAEALANRRFVIDLSDPSETMMVGSLAHAEVRLVTPQLKAPALTVTLPASNAKSLALPGTFLAFGMVSDLQGIDRVEMEYDGEVFVTRPVSPSGNKVSAQPWVIPVTPNSAGPMSLTFTAYNLSGLSTTVKRSFVFIARAGLTVEGSAPVGVDSASAGTVNVKALPSSGLARVPKPVAGAVPPAFMAPSWAVDTGVSVTLTATPKKGYVFSHWEGFPVDAQLQGHQIMFNMPADGVPGLRAVFATNPFTQGTFASLGAKPVFQGLLRPDTLTEPGNDTVGFLSATLVPASGNLSGRISMDGLQTSFTGALYGDGSVWFKAGRVMSPVLAFADRELTMTWDTDGLAIGVTSDEGKVSGGVARPPFYSKTRKVRSELLDAKGPQGYYTLALPATQQNPARSAAEYPQGTGFATLTLRNDGTVRVVGMLAEGTRFTASSYLTEGDEAVLYAVQPTPGGKTKKGSLLGTLVFDEMQADSDVDSTDLTWFRPEADTKMGVLQAYREGWPDGIDLGLVGTKYDKTIPAQTLLGLTGSGWMSFSGGKLMEEVEVTNFRLIGNKVTKNPPADRSFTLSFQTTGLFQGTFTPDWNSARLPSFRGVLLGKGSNRGGWGFFLGNEAGDLSPESGPVVIGNPD